MAQIIQDWAAEISRAIEANPDRRIVFLRGAGGSQKYFAKKVLNQLPETLREKVTIMGNGPTRKEFSDLAQDFDTFIKTDFYVFDDAINSAQQITGIVFPDIFYMAEKLEFHAKTNDKYEEFYAFVNDRLGTKPTFNIRTMRITHYAKNRIQAKWAQRKDAADLARDAVYPESIILNVASSGTMKTVNEVLDPLGIQWTNGQKPGFLYRQDHVVGYPILGCFATKIQDNLPPAMLRSNNTPADLEPLFAQTDITTPWKSISNEQAQIT